MICLRNTSHAMPYNSGTGELRVSGQLFRIVRTGENFRPPLELISQMRFGKSDANLDFRDRWHLNDYQKMAQMDSARATR